MTARGPVWHPDEDATLKAWVEGAPISPADAERLAGVLGRSQWGVRARIYALRRDREAAGWVRAIHASRPGGTDQGPRHRSQAREVVAPRKCSSCRALHTPPSRYLFRCEGCRRRDAMGTIA